jgi:hypothetical protein
MQFTFNEAMGRQSPIGWQAEEEIRGTEDEAVEESSEESFQASDPPAY